MSGGSKPEKPEVQKATTIFKNTKSATVTNPFGSSTTAIQPKGVTQAMLDADATSRQSALQAAIAAGYGRPAPQESSTGGLGGRLNREGSGSKNPATSYGFGPITDDVLKRFGYSPLNTKQTEITTDAQLPDYLSGIPKLAGQGVESNLSFLQQTPQQQYDQAVGGNNPLYNILMENTNRAREQALGRSLVDYNNMGTANSTTAGSAQGTILNDAIMQGNQNLLNAINFSNETGRANLGANLNSLGSMANLLYPTMSLGNANAMQAWGQRDATAMANANAQNAANLQHAQAMNQYNQQRASSLGGMIGGGIGLLGSAALAPFTGGASLMAAPGMMSNMFGGGGGSVPYIPQQGFGGNIPGAIPAITGNAPIQLGFGSTIGNGFGTPIY